MIQNGARPDLLTRITRPSEMGCRCGSGSKPEQRSTGWCVRPERSSVGTDANAEINDLMREAGTTGCVAAAQCEVCALISCQFHPFPIANSFRADEQVIH